MDLRQVDTDDAMESGPDIERQRIDLLSLHASLGKWADGSRRLDGERRDGRLQLDVAVHHLGLIRIVELQCLRQREDVLVAVVAYQRRADRLGGRMAANIARRHQYVGVSLARHDDADDPHARRTGDVRDDMVKLEARDHQSS